MEIPVSFFSLSLTSFGAVLAILGVLLTNPRDIINDSYISGGPTGMIDAILLPSEISDFMRFRNKATLSIITISAGFILGLPWFKEKVMPISLLIVLVFILLFLFILIPGWTRRVILKKWRSESCKINWFFRIFDEKSFKNEKDKWTKSHQLSEFLNSSLIRFKHIRDALDLDIELSWQNRKKPTLNELESFRVLVQDEINNTGFLYYLLKPRKLLRAYK
jgi:hypothetical protein